MKCVNCLNELEGPVWSFSYNNPSDGAKINHFCSLSCYYQGLNSYTHHVKNLAMPKKIIHTSNIYMPQMTFGSNNESTTVLYMDGDAVETAEPTPEIKQITELKVPKSVFENTDILNSDELTEIIQLAHLQQNHKEITKSLSDISYPKIEITEGSPLSDLTATKLAHYKFKTIFDVILIKIAENSIKSHYQKCSFHEIDIEDQHNYAAKFPIGAPSSNYLSKSLAPADVLEVLNSRSVMKTDFLKSAVYINLVIPELDNLVIEIQGDFPNLNIKIHDRVYKIDCTSFIKTSYFYMKFKQDTLKTIDPNDIYVENKFNIQKSISVAKAYMRECNTKLVYNNDKKVRNFKKALIDLLEFHTKTP